MGDDSPKNKHKLEEQRQEEHEKKEHEKHENAEEQHHLHRGPAEPEGEPANPKPDEA